MNRLRKRWLRLPVLYGMWCAFVLLCIPIAVQASNVYGGGTYGTCQYGSCGITLTSNGVVSDNVTLGPTTTCSVQSDSVSVMTDSDAGYTLSVSDNATNSQMSGSHGGVIAASQGKNNSPMRLSTHTWGYRVDGVGGFGSGPTLASTSGGVPSLTFAGVPNSLATPDTIASSTNAADPAVITSVWYGVCADTSLPDGTYSSSVTYTAVAN